MEHVGIVVGDLAAATEFFVELGLVLQGEGPYVGLMSEIVGSVWVCAPSAPRNTTSS
jgi:catechol 2,3-dioxygenase-like lactoylglutathione lyase family enzyme